MIEPKTGGRGWPPVPPTDRYRRGVVVLNLLETVEMLCRGVVSPETAREFVDSQRALYPDVYALADEAKEYHRAREER